MYVWQFLCNYYDYINFLLNYDHLHLTILVKTKLLNICKSIINIALYSYKKIHNQKGGALVPYL